MPNVKGRYKVVRIYNNDYKTEKAIRENLTEKQAIDHCNSKYARGIEDGKTYRDFYTYM